MFLCKFSRGEEVIKAGGRVRCTISNGTCSYTVDSRQMSTIETALGIELANAGLGIRMKL
jgi:hypothetical protein